MTAKVNPSTVKCSRLYNPPVKFISAMMIVGRIRWTSGYATWFTAGGAIRIANYDAIDDVITRKL